MRTWASALRLLAAGVLLVALAGCTVPAPEDAVARARVDLSGYRGGAALPQPYAMPDSTLTDTAGAPYDLRTSPSRPVTLLFFGYTHCPDVCGGVLSDLATALTRMPASSRDRVQVVYVTTDPARDTPAVLGRYLARFDPAFLGLTGPLPTVVAVASRVGVDIEGVRALPGAGYEVGHTAQLLGFDRAHRGVVLWTPSTTIGDLAADLELLVSRQQ